jgi:regulator of RNase E activity RraA
MSTLEEKPENRAETLRFIANLPVPTLAAILFRKGYEKQFVTGLVPLSRKRFAGPAYTLRAIPTRPDVRAALASGAIRNLHRVALADIPAGAVLVADSGQTKDCSMLGDILAESLQVRGVAGVVLDGGAADTPRLAELDMPVVCAGSAPVPWLGRLYVADVQVPIDLCGVAVFPGDIVVGDACGVIVVPSALAEEVAREAQEKEDMEVFILERIRAGAPVEGTYPPNAATLAEYAAWREMKTTR